MYTKQHFILSILSVLLFAVIFMSIYSINKSYATITFDIKVIQSKVSQLNGQLYYSSGDTFHKDLMKSFILRSTMLGEFQTASIPITHKNIKSIRLDPLPNAGEIIIKNFSIVQGSWFNTKTQTIDLTKININKLRNIKVINKEKSFLHLHALGSDPHLDITYNIHPLMSLIDYSKLTYIFLVSFLISFLLISIIYGFKIHYLKGSEIIFSIIILLYTTYTFLYGIHFSIAQSLIILLPALSVFIIYQQKTSLYYSYLKNIIIILTALTIVTFISDYINGVTRIYAYFTSLYTIIVPAIILSLAFIQKKYFNYHFYKNFLMGLTIFLAFLSTALHYEVILIDTIITHGYRMSMSPWAQKNYTFWYLFLMWGTLSFFQFKPSNTKESFIIIFILCISYISIMSGYSDSAKLAFILSTLIYFIFSAWKFKLKLLMLIPTLISLYIILTPWIADIYVYFSDLHRGIAGRESIFAIYSDMIKEHLLFGYGYNITGYLNPTEHVTQEIMERYSENRWLYECVPHSTLLLLWLNFGLIGISLFTIVTYLSLKKLIILTYYRNNQAALIALVSSFMLIISFSWGNWRAYSLLTFSFFLGMIFLSLNINHLKK